MVTAQDSAGIDSPLISLLTSIISLLSNLCLYFLFSFFFFCILPPFCSFPSLYSSQFKLVQVTTGVGSNRSHSLSLSTGKTFRLSSWGSLVSSDPVSCDNKMQPFFSFLLIRVMLLKDPTARV